MLSTDLTEFIRSVLIALSLTDRNETERIKPDSDTEIDNRTTETSERTYIYSGRVGYGRAGQGGVWKDRRKVGVGLGGGRVGYMQV